MPFYALLILFNKGENMKLTAENLKNELWDTLKKVKSGEMHVKTANSVSSSAANIIQVVKTEIMVQKMEAIETK